MDEESVGVEVIIKNVMTEYADFLNGYPSPDFEVALVFDDQHGQYILRRIVWHQNNDISIRISI